MQQVGPEAEVAGVRASEGSPNPTELSRGHLRLRDSLQSPAAEQLADTPLVALGAARLGSTRLIDNLEF